MHARDETILFSAIAILLAALALRGLADLVPLDARAVTDGRELRVSRDAACTSTAAAPAARSGARQRG